MRPARALWLQEIIFCGSAPVYSRNPRVKTGSSIMNRRTDTSPMVPPRASTSAERSALRGSATTSARQLSEPYSVRKPKKSPCCIWTLCMRKRPRRGSDMAKRHSSFRLGMIKWELSTTTGSDCITGLRTCRPRARDAASSTFVSAGRRS